MSSVLGVALPAEWSATRLKHGTSLLNRGTTPSYVDDGPVRVISQAANQDYGLDWERTQFHDFHGDASKLKGYLQPHDLLINSTGTGTLGRIGYFEKGPDTVPCIADTHITVARSDREVLHPRFGYYWMASRPFQEYIYAALVVGATNQIELNRNYLCDAPLPLPPLEEQRRIADFLDPETARIDHLVASRKHQLALLDEHHYADISETLIPGILSESLGRWPWTWLPEVSVDRPLVRLGYVCRLQNGITVDGKRDSSGDVVTRPYLRVANVQAGYLTLDTVTDITVPRELAKNSTLRPGDVLMTEGGDLDKLGRGTVWKGEFPDCLHQNHIFALRPDSNRLDGTYLSYMTQTVHGRCYFESTGMKTTNLASTNSTKILGFPVPLPTVKRQRVLTQQIQEKSEALERGKDALARQVYLLIERRQALVTAAVTGQIDVSTAASGRLDT